MTGCVVALDLVTKSWAFSALGPREERAIIPHWLMFRRSLNDGAVFGSFTGQVGLFILASLFALGFVFYLFARSADAQWGLHITLAMIVAGALGNLYDRAIMKADVVRVHHQGSSDTLMIGTVVGPRDAEVLRVGEWPEGSLVQTFKRRDVALSRQGVVRDFIKFVPVFPSWVPRLAGHDVWPWVFNVADASLVCGVFALLLTSARDRR